MPLHQICFGPFALDENPVRLSRGEEPIRLRPKSLKVLQYLAERPGKLIGKEELFKRVWSDRVVSESGLRICVREIRAALGDTADTPQYLETIAGRGYRFLEGHDGRTVLSDTIGPIVGRDSELRRLEDYYKLVVDGDRKFVLLSGEPGIGKTTLLENFLDHVSGQSTTKVIQGQCVVHYGKSEAYGPILDAITDVCRGQHTAEIIRILKHSAPSWLLQLPGLIDPFEFEQLQHQAKGMAPERMTREFHQAIEELTNQGPLIIVIEDLHWADISTIDLLATLAELPISSLFILGTYRPADAVLYTKSLRDTIKELKGRSHCEEMSLELLSKDNLATYLTERLGGNVSNELIVQIYRRTDGNPLFFVNLVDDLIQKQALVLRQGYWTVASNTHIISEDVPESLRSLISRRVDSLPKNLKLILETASVVGLEFNTAAMASALEQTPQEVESQCEALSAQGQFIENRGVDERPNGILSGRYRFQHSLYLEVLYGAIGEARRAQIHRFIGESLEEEYGDRTDEIAAALANHFDQGHDAKRTILYRKLAAKQAIHRHAYRESIDQLTHVLGTLKRLPESTERDKQELEFLLQLGPCLIAIEGYTTQRVEQNFNRAQGLCEKLKNKSYHATILWNLAAFRMVRAELTQSRSLIEQYVELVKGAPDEDLDLLGHDALGQQLFFEGEFALAHQQLKTVINRYDVENHRHLAESYGQEDPGVACTSIDSLVLWLLGFSNQSRTKLQTVQTLSNEIENPHSTAFGQMFACFTSQLRHDPLDTQKRADELIQGSIEHGLHWMPIGQILKGWAMAQQNTDIENLEMVKSGLYLWQESGVQLAVPYCLGLLADTHRRLGQMEDAHATVVEALSLVEKNGERWFEAELHRLQGEILLEQDHKQEAEAMKYFEQALQVARAQQAKSLELRAALSLSRLWVQQGQSREARKLLEPIFTWFTEGLETQELGEAKDLMTMN